MRWTNKPKREENKLITRKWFAWTPITIGNETRWLETVTVRGYWWVGKFSGLWRFTVTDFVNP